MSIDVLIVDDSVTIRAMIKKALQLCLPELGEVTEAENGISALARLSEKKIDLILTDINMPRMDGARLIEKLKTQPKLVDIPIIVISTDGSRERIVNLEHHGVRGYLHKPFRPEQLKELLSEILETANDSQSNNSGGCDF
jgi:two-component system chemotaxis response regulator CheY